MVKLITELLLPLLVSLQLTNTVQSQVNVNYTQPNEQPTSSNQVENYENRIIGGEEVNPPFQFPWMAAIRKKGGSYCGGVMISSNEMLTAAHCSKDGDLDDFRVLTHRHDLRKPREEENGYSLRVKKLAVWILESSDFKLKARIRYSSMSLRPPEKNKPLVATALGWGWVHTGGPGSAVLRQADIPLVPAKQCKRMWMRKGVKLNSLTQICAGWPDGRKDTCKGDSGGPLFYKDNGKYKLLGLTSFGEPCAKALTPTVYTRVAKFRSWINRTLGRKPKPHKPRPQEPPQEHPQDDQDHEHEHEHEHEPEDDDDEEDDDDNLDDDDDEDDNGNGGGSGGGSGGGNCNADERMSINLKAIKRFYIPNQDYNTTLVPATIRIKKMNAVEDDDNWSVMSN